MLYKIRSSYYLILIFIVLISCTTDEGLPEDYKSEAVMTDVSYGSDPKQTYDAYLPAGRNTSSTNALVLVHGGFWFAGDKEDWQEHEGKIQEIMPETAIFTINYRLTGSEGQAYALTDQLEDLALFLEYLEQKQDSFAIRDQVALFGFSAGAHMALRHSYAHTNDESIKVVASMCGPTHFLDSAYIASDSPFLWLVLTITQSLTGVELAGNTSFYEELSPYYHVSSNAQPTLLLYGEADPIVPTSQATFLKDKLDEFAVPNQYKLYQDEEHGWASQDNWEDTFLLLQQFMAQHM